MVSTISKLDQVEKLISSKIISDNEPEVFFKKVVENFCSNNENKTVEELIEECSKEDKIEKILIETETDDDGGIIAMSGFYYQLLLTIDYMIQMLEGKWNKVVIDHHQDIIVYNSEVVRVIQVKTKNDIFCNVTDTKAHSEWIPKLIATQKILNNPSLDIKIEFELISNCTFTKGIQKCLDFENYYKNKDFDSTFSVNQKSLYSIISEKSSKYELNDDEIKKALQSFKVTTRNPIDLKNDLYTRIAKQFNDYSRANDKIINMIISFLFEKCFNPTDVSFQIVNDSNLIELKADISAEFQNVGEKSIQEDSMIEILGDFIEEIKSDFSDKDFSEEFYDIINDLESEIIFFINDSKNENLLTVLSRYLKRIRYSSHFRMNNPISRKTEFKRILDILFLIKIFLNGNIRINNSSSKLLLVSCDNEDESLFSSFNLFGVEGKYDVPFKEVIAQFQETFKGFSFEEQFMLINNPNFRVILSGAYDNFDKDEVESIEVECKEKPKIKFDILSNDLNELDTSIAIVKNRINYIEGQDDKVVRIRNMKNRYNSIDSIKDNIQKEFNL